MDDYELTKNKRKYQAPFYLWVISKELCNRRWKRGKIRDGTRKGKITLIVQIFLSYSFAF